MQGVHTIHRLFSGRLSRAQRLAIMVGVGLLSAYMGPTSAPPTVPTSYLIIAPPASGLGVRRQRQSDLPGYWALNFNSFRILASPCCDRYLFKLNCRVNKPC
jgi:hypothetical protein